MSPTATPPDAAATTDDPVLALLNQLIGGYWAGTAQHQTHAAVLASWGLQGLVDAMRQHIDDEPETITALTDRLLELDGQPRFALAAPRIGSTLREVLGNDLAAQQDTRPLLNAAAERAAAAHDATTRRLIERILQDEERHLDWLRTEVALLEQLGEPLYMASRLR